MVTGHACCFDAVAEVAQAWHAGAERETALQEFYDAWKDEPLVLLKWISIQVPDLTRRTTWPPECTAVWPPACYVLFSLICHA